MNQLGLFGLMELGHYNYIVISSSGGKDSQAIFAQVALQGVEGRLIVMHTDLGDMEWPTTKEVAQAQADVFGVSFEVVSRIGQVAKQTSAGG